ncbi:MAG: hypothetical protein Q9191_003673 [Dirinaria sp. TL-2023a]
MAAPAIRPRRYRECLTPALHRRFNRAVGLVLGICYVEAVLMGEKSSSPLSIFVLRVAQLHIGARSTVSPFQTFVQQVFSFSAVQTFGWYAFSAWWFSEIYIWSAAADANLGWISAGKYGMIRRLKTVCHLGLDYDKISLPLEKAPAEPVAQDDKSATEAKPPRRIQPLDDLKARLPSTLRMIGIQSASIAFVGPIVYALCIRRRAWNISMFLAKLVQDVAPVTELSYIPPYHISLIWRSMISGFLLVFLWQSSNAIFSAFFAQEPLKNSQPVTAASTDPNASLLGGLKSNKESFAYWELLYIALYFPTRRASIFTEIARPTGSTWSQIKTESLLTISSVSTRISNHLNPPTATPPAQQQQQQPPSDSLPRLTPGLRQDPIFAPPSTPNTLLKKFSSGLSSTLKSYGESPPPTLKSNPLTRFSPQAKRLTGAAGQKLLTSSQHEALTTKPQSLRATFSSYMHAFIRSPLGHPFRQPFSRRVNAIAFGTSRGYTDVFIVANAIDALTLLTLCSLKEDPYGKVAYDVEGILQTFCNTFTSLQEFVDRLEEHWTDVDDVGGGGGGGGREGGKEVKDVEIVKQRLRAGLGSLVDAFGPYAEDFGIRRAVLERARQLVGEVENGGGGG